MSRIKFLNTYIDSLTVSEAKARVDEMVQKRTPQYVVTPNTDIVMRMQREPDLLEICNKADLILTDGEMLVKLSKFLGNPIKERVAMTDFVWDVCDLTSLRRSIACSCSEERKVCLRKERSVFRISILT